MRVYASTKPDYVLPTDEALIFAGHEAGICYMREDFDAILHEDTEVTMRRVKGTIGSGHHSVLGHTSYCMILEDVPKIIAMLLNNEHDYNASEKSARYTKMRTGDEEQRLYEKWIAKFEKLIAETYPQMNPKSIRKLALENARYFISVFTPSTTIGYTADLRQINYLIGWCEEMISRETYDDPFMKQLKPWLAELLNVLSPLNVPGLRDGKGRAFSLFAEMDYLKHAPCYERKEHFGDTYCTNYVGTFSQLAQAQRHRTLWYEMRIPIPGVAQFFVPPIIRDESLKVEYLEDMRSLSAFFPQGMLVHINESGTAELFALKCEERLCGAAQLEVCLQTEETLQKYLKAVDPATNPGYEHIYRLLKSYDGKTKCQFGHYSCDRPCPLGPQNAFTRLV